MDRDKRLIQDTVIAVLASKGAIKPPDCYRATESRLYAYPILKDNIERYKLDIEDLKKEKVTEKSKDITCWMGNSGVRLTPEEKQQGKIMAVEIKLARDEAEVAEIDNAMERLDGDSRDLIRRVYISAIPLDKVAQELNVSLSTMQRNKNRVIRRLAVMLYGAEALA